MPLLFPVPLIILIAQIGFWNTLGAILGAAMMMILLSCLPWARWLLAASSSSDV